MENMKRPITIVALVLIGTFTMAQVPSHAPTIAVDSASVNTAPSGPSPKVTGKAVVRVNGSVLTDQDLVREMYTIFPYARQHSGGFPVTIEPQIRQGAMEMIIFEELVYQEAQLRKMTIPAARTNRAEAEFKKQFASEPEFQQFLRVEFSGSRQLFRQKINRSLLIQDLLKIEVEAKSHVSDLQLKAFYDKNPSKFEYPEALAIQSISILPPKNASPEVVKEAATRADEAYRQAQATKDYKEFGLLAEKVSDDDFHVNMGDHKLVEAGKLPPEIVKAAASMKPGQVSEMIQVGNNYTFFRLNAHVPAGKTDLVQVKDKLRADLQKEKYNQVRSDLNKKLRKTAKVEVL